jgi:hypothetical protein
MIIKKRAKKSFMPPPEGGIFTASIRRDLINPRAKMCKNKEREKMCIVSVSLSQPAANNEK